MDMIALIYRLVEPAKFPLFGKRSDRLIEPKDRKGHQNNSSRKQNHDQETGEGELRTNCGTGPHETECYKRHADGKKRR